MWTKEDVKHVVNAMSGGHYPDVPAAMTATAELLAARGGTMTAEQLSALLSEYNDESFVREVVIPHVTAQGARVAVLEAESKARLALADAWKAQAERMEQERDAARTELARVQERADRLDVALSERTQTYQQAAQERDAALADNAARTRIGAQMANACFNLVQCKEMTAEDVLTLDRLRQEWDALGPHPGSALLEAHSKALVRARNEGLERVAAAMAAEVDRVRLGIAKLNLASDVGQARHRLLSERRDMADAFVTRIRAMKEPES